MPADLLLPAQLESLHQPETQQQQAQRLSVEDDLPLEEKAKLLQAEFESASAADVSALLATCDGSLFAATELLAEMLQKMRLPRPAHAACNQRARRRHCLPA
jgi:hypothetical protein